MNDRIRVGFLSARGFVFAQRLVLFVGSLGLGRGTAKVYDAFGRIAEQVEKVWFTDMRWYEEVELFECVNCFYSVQPSDHTFLLHCEALHVRGCHAVNKRPFFPGTWRGLDERFDRIGHCCSKKARLPFFWEGVKEIR